MPSTKLILIASCLTDRPTCLPVKKYLEHRGHKTIVFDAEKVAFQRTGFDIFISSDDSHIKYGRHIIRPELISAAWFRRPYAATKPAIDGAVQVSLDSERKLIQSYLWNSIPSNLWLNSPENITLSSSKLTQLRVAQEIGFIIPKTLITNQPTSIHRHLGAKIICKACQPILFDGDKFKQVNTTLFDNTTESIPPTINPYPAIWQSAIPKAKEWRITIVGKRSFDVAIYTTKEAKDDWRQHQHDSTKVKFKPEKFPQNTKSLCYKYLRKYNLNFGAFDFIQTPDGQIVFLECNPNGQYMWLEQELGLPISEAIADELIKISGAS